jgi:hypothetical protein
MPPPIGRGLERPLTERSKAAKGRAVQAGLPLAMATESELWPAAVRVPQPASDREVAPAGPPTCQANYRDGLASGRLWPLEKETTGAA